MDRTDQAAELEQILTVFDARIVAPWKGVASSDPRGVDAADLEQVHDRLEALLDAMRADSYDATPDISSSAAVPSAAPRQDADSNAGESSQGTSKGPGGPPPQATNSPA